MDGTGDPLIDNFRYIDVVDFPLVTTETYVLSYYTSVESLEGKRRLAYVISSLTFFDDRVRIDCSIRCLGTGRRLGFAPQYGFGCLR